MTFDEAMRILRALESHRVRYVLIGSMAMAVHGLVRATRDMDFFVAPDEANVAQLRAALFSVFNDSSVHEITAADLAGDYPAIQYVPPHGDYSIDIIARLGETFSFEEIESEVKVIDMVTLHVATPRMLYRMKIGTVRPQDKADAFAIQRHFKLDSE